MWFECDIRGMRLYLHEVLSSDEALRAERVDQSAGVLLVLIRTVQGTHDDLTQHLRQEVLGSLHVSHAAHSLGQVLTVQVLSHDRLLKWRFKNREMSCGRSDHQTWKIKNWSVLSTAEKTQIWRLCFWFGSLVKLFSVLFQYRNVGCGNSLMDVFLIAPLYCTPCCLTVPNQICSTVFPLFKYCNRKICCFAYRHFQQFLPGRRRFLVCLLRFLLDGRRVGLQAKLWRLKQKGHVIKTQI